LSKRRRSREVTLVAIPVLAAAFAACGGTNNSAYCVDRSDRIVENRNCDGLGTAGYFWYYGGHVGNGARFAPGTRIGGGDRVVSTNVSENVRRGGFGGSSESRSGSVGRSVAHSGGG
jgi:hypothetical protein